MPSLSLTAVILANHCTNPSHRASRRVEGGDTLLRLTIQAVQHSSLACQCTKDQGDHRRAIVMLRVTQRKQAECRR